MSRGWILFWAIVCFPIAILGYMTPEKSPPPHDYTKDGDWNEEGYRDPDTGQLLTKDQVRKEKNRWNEQNRWALAILISVVLVIVLANA
ncbi:MAG: hypothetical protein HRU33_21910 [Rhodobacteraceae bacterium]|nr:hypothetical protein [Paracoccaceae bacterium]